jgi:hypothetical protein
MTPAEVESTVREHLGDNDGELLLHLLSSGLRRLAIAWFSAVQNEPLH